MYTSATSTVSGFAPIGSVPAELDALVASAQDLLSGVTPIKPKQIAELHARMGLEMKVDFATTEIFKDKFHPLTQVYRLAKTLEGLAERISKGEILSDKYCCGGSNGAYELFGKLISDQEENTYVCKPTRLQEYDFNVPTEGGAKREQVAYLCDTNHFARVPPTFCMDLSEFKLGVCSLQHYEKGCRELYYSPDKRVDMKALRRIAIHNLRMLNLDASSMNILIRKFTPIPIDFGYSLPPFLAEKPNIDMHKLIPEGPFDEEETSYVQSLDRSKLAGLLQAHGISDMSIKKQQAVVHMLQSAVKTRDITLRDLLMLFYDGARNETVEYVGGYGGFDGRIATIRISFSREMRLISEADTEQEREVLIQQAFDNLRQAKPYIRNPIPNHMYLISEEVSEQERKTFIQQTQENLREISFSNLMHRISQADTEKERDELFQQYDSLFR